MSNMIFTMWHLRFRLFIPQFTFFKNLVLVSWQAFISSLVMKLDFMMQLKCFNQLTKFLSDCCNTPKVFFVYFSTITTVTYIILNFHCLFLTISINIWYRWQQIQMKWLKLIIVRIFLTIVSCQRRKNDLGAR